MDTIEVTLSDALDLAMLEDLIQYKQFERDSGLHLQNTHLGRLRFQRSRRQTCARRRRPEFVAHTEGCLTTYSAVTQ